MIFFILNWFLLLKDGLNAGERNDTELGSRAQGSSINIKGKDGTDVLIVVEKIRRKVRGLPDVFSTLCHEKLEKFQGKVRYFIKKKHIIPNFKNKIMINNTPTFNENTAMVNRNYLGLRDIFDRHSCDTKKGLYVYFYFKMRRNGLKLEMFLLMEFETFIL